MKLDETEEGNQDRHWTPPVLKTISTEGVGVKEVVNALNDHAIYLKSNSQWKLRDAARLQEELNELLMAAFAAEWRKKVDQSKIEVVLGEMLARKVSPINAAKKLLGY